MGQTIRLRTKDCNNNISEAIVRKQLEKIATDIWQPITTTKPHNNDIVSFIESRMSGGINKEQEEKQDDQYVDNKVLKQVQNMASLFNTMKEFTAPLQMSIERKVDDITAAVVENAFDPQSFEILEFEKRINDSLKRIDDNIDHVLKTINYRCDLIELKIRELTGNKFSCENCGISCINYLSSYCPNCGCQIDQWLKEDGTPVQNWVHYSKRDK